MKNTSLQISDKISYIQNELWKNRKHFRLVTKKSIRTILNHPPFNDNVDIDKLPYDALQAAQKINQKLIFQLGSQTMLDIIHIAKE